MRVHQQHYSFQTVYKKIKSQSNNTCVCSDRTKQIKHESPAKIAFIYGSRDGSATGLIQNLAANIWKQDEKKKKNTVHWKNVQNETISTTEAQTFANLFTVHQSLIKIKTLASFFFLACQILESSQSRKMSVCPQRGCWYVGATNKPLSTQLLPNGDFPDQATKMVEYFTQMNMSFHLKL